MTFEEKKEKYLKKSMKAKKMQKTKFKKLK